MSTAAPSSDAELLDMLRSQGPMGVTDMAGVIEVTPTAVRQRLGRLMAQGLVEREAIRAGRGRPKHRYQLTQKGVRLTGSNFTDLALALWREIGAIENMEVRKSLLRRVVRALASGYAQEMEGKTTTERMHSLSRILEQRRVPFSVDSNGERPVLTAHACPYPELAENDRGICVLEKILFSELLGEDVQLSQCRLDGAESCQFQPKSIGDILNGFAGDGLRRPPMRTMDEGRTTS
ncbi:MAG: helix-turn-helix transcriptional regulator [Pirellulales bacterium]|nr:helix-turn-helix transcriptional regulator [Pirellulales bacterium]